MKKEQSKSAQTLNKEFVKKAIFQRYFWEIKISFICIALVFFYATFSFSEVRVGRISSIIAVCIILYFIVIVNLPNDLYSSIKRNQVKYLELLRYYNLFEISRAEKMLERAEVKLAKGEDALMDIPLIQNTFLLSLKEKYKKHFDPISWNVDPAYNKYMTFCCKARGHASSLSIIVSNIDSEVNEAIFGSELSKLHKTYLRDLNSEIRNAQIQRECIRDYIAKRKQTETQIGELLKAMDAYKVEGDYEKSGLLSFVTRFF